MQRNILIDLNVILDLLLERRGYESSQEVLALGASNGYQLFISAHMVTTFAYLLEHAKVPTQQITTHLHWLLKTFNVVPVDDTILGHALKSRIKDYEDAVVEQAAIACKAEAIITHNIKDFESSAIKAVVPELFLQRQ